MESRDAASDAMDPPNAAIHLDIDAWSLHSAAGREQRDAGRLPLLMQPPQPSCEDLLLRQTDLLQLWLPILDAHALARLSLVSKRWHACASDEQLWEMHCRADAECSQCAPDVVALMGGWRRFYASSAQGKYLRAKMFPFLNSEGLTFADIWQTTGEILWDNVVCSFFDVSPVQKQERLWREKHLATRTTRA